MESIRITAVDTTMPEDASRYVLHPEAYVLRNFWDPLMRALACFFFLEIPFAIAYRPEKTIGMPASLILGRILSYPMRTPYQHSFLKPEWRNRAMLGASTAAP